MGAVFAAAARAPLTSLASVVEMTGDFSLTLPVMLAVAIATMVSRALTYGTIYTTKLLRRGTDIDQAAPWRALADLKITDVMRPFAPALPVPPDPADAPAAGALPYGNGSSPGRAVADGPLAERHDPQALFTSESLAQTLRQLEVYGRDGLPVLSPDGRQVEGWITSATVLRALARQIAGAQAADSDHDDETEAALRHPPGSAGRLRGRGDHDRCGLARGRAQAGRGHLAAGRHPGLAAARAAARPARPRRRAGRRRPGRPADPDAAGTGPAGPGRAAAGPCGRRRPGRRVA